MLRAVDADTHIFESPQVWDFMDEQMYPRRPIIVSAPRDTVYKRGSFWLIDGNIFPKSAGKGGFLLGTPTEPGQSRATRRHGFNGRRYPGDLPDPLPGVRHR